MAGQSGNITRQETVPNTAFPPPPVAGLFCSSTGNASCGDAERAHKFCEEFPLYRPVKPFDAMYSSVQRYDLCPSRSPEFCGNISVVDQGRWRGSTTNGNGDCLLTTNLPLYFSMKDSPFLTKTSKTIYFEVRLIDIRDGPATQSTDDSGFSVGFVAQPYPTWRFPGWERGSLGVFSDDGCRFVNDSWGGKSFTSKFTIGETVGLGMTFRLPMKAPSTPANEDEKVNVEVFFTRNRLGGDFDLYGALGLFGGVDFEVLFDPAVWLWTPQDRF
ncbi:SSH4 family protein [Aspergillus ibericus CBS 121593]|uniref:SPRY domain-containing protein n=1 Tax=Aspergillus ibericus CBS 121593 TaxID=1448316 RepID=A0A395H8Z2_9EURO|nr:hypothetical protein BO80DRAFT_491120 [Aspergillus ibericus CBS 121593]RAL04377.1 hypothetical protein BO80DRAFT_491120 [Aspergillus ibericus CBS 121593]